MQLYLLRAALLLAVAACRETAVSCSLCAAAPSDLADLGVSLGRRPALALHLRGGARSKLTQQVNKKSRMALDSDSEGLWDGQGPRRKDKKEFHAKARSIIEQEEGTLISEDEQEEDEGSDVQEESMDFEPIVTAGSLDDVFQESKEGPKTVDELADSADVISGMSDFEGRASRDSSSVENTAAADSDEEDSLIEDWVAPEKGEQDAVEVKGRSQRERDEEMSTDDTSADEGPDLPENENEAESSSKQESVQGSGHDYDDGAGQDEYDSLTMRGPDWGKNGSCLAEGSQFLGSLRQERARDKGGVPADDNYKGGPTSVYSGLKDGRRVEQWQGKLRSSMTVYEPLYGGPPAGARDGLGEEAPFDETVIPVADVGDSVTVGGGDDDATAAERNLRAEQQFEKEWAYWESKDSHLTPAFRNYLWHRCLWDNMCDPAVAMQKDQQVELPAKEPYDTQKSPVARKRAL